MKNITKLLLIASLLLVASCNNSAEKKDSANAGTSESEKLHPLRNGFSIFTLGSNINDYSKSVKLIEEGFHKSSYEVTDSNLLNINESLKVDAININTWDGYISLIEVKVSDHYKAKFLDLLVSSYGRENNKDRGSLQYIWSFHNSNDTKVIYDLKVYGSTQGIAMFITEIDTPLPSKELIYQAEKNISDI